MSTGQAMRSPDYMHADRSADRRALRLADLCCAMWHWRMSMEDVARHLGCGAPVLEGWLAASAGDAPPEPPPVVGQRVRRLVVLEQMRPRCGCVGRRGARFGARRPLGTRRPVR